jgi:predicted homoserine dehydrogenase-like protein
LRWGVYVTFAADSDYVRRCFQEYGLVTDSTATTRRCPKPFHLIGLELAISVASVGLRREATGAATGFRGDVVATAKRDLKAGETLDGEGGHTVYGNLMPAADSLVRRPAARPGSRREALSRRDQEPYCEMERRCGDRQRRGAFSP